MLTAETVIRQPASFRDPSGFVFDWDGRIFRAVDAACLETIRKVRDSGLLDALIGDGLVVATEIIEHPATIEPLREAFPEAAGFLEHARIDPISFPYEWSLSMLADAGIATLDVQMRLLEHGYSLKDATAYNIQFVAGRPVFIDLPSIERPRRLDIWTGLGQFNRMFTLPLLLNRHKGFTLRSCFLAHLDGIEVDQARRAFSCVELLKPGLLLDLAMPYWLGRLAENSAVKTPQTIDGTDRGPKVQLMNLRRLRAKIEKLSRGYRPAGLWADYTAACNYSDRAEESKVTAVRAFLDEHRPASVLDVGSNTGRYSQLAAESGARVIAIDSDPASVEILYRRVRDDEARAAAGEPGSILPLCVDIANPSPAIGFRNVERPSFLDRTHVECVFALAVIHHLHVSANLPVAGIRDLLADLTDEYLVLEFVPTDDSMFRRLMRFRVDLYRDFTLERCVETFAERFELLRRVPVAESGRTLLFWRKHAR